MAEEFITETPAYLTNSTDVNKMVTYDPGTAGRASYKVLESFISVRGNMTDNTITPTISTEYKSAASSLISAQASKVTVFSMAAGDSAPNQNITNMILVFTVPLAFPLDTPENIRIWHVDNGAILKTFTTADNVMIAGLTVSPTLQETGRTSRRSHWDI